MRKQFLIPLLLLCVSVVVQAAYDVSGHTFFTVRPPFQTAFPEKVTLFRNIRARALDCDGGWLGAWQIVPFGGRSTQSKQLGTYFLPGSKVFGEESNVLVFSETNIASPNPATTPPSLFRDVNPYFFNIISNGGQNTGFRSQVAFNPRQSYAGAGFDWIQYFGWGCEPCDKRWWFEVSFPVEWVRNDMRLTETVLTPGFVPLNANVNTSVIEAFKGLKGQVNTSAAVAGVSPKVTGSGWAFGKIDGARHHTGVADVELKLGYDWVCNDCFHAYSYIGGVIPTGNKPKGVYVFEPIVGNNHHFGVMWGTAFGFEWWRSCDGDKSLRWEFEVNSRYLFRNTQVRSFDLYDKQWSRYQTVYTSLGDANFLIAEEGINFFTRRFRVTPRFQFDLNSGFVFNACAFEGEVGMNFWARQCERVKLRDPWTTNLVFTDAPAVIGTGNRAITIRENFVNAGVSIDTAPEYALAAIQENEINLESVAHPTTLSHIAYGSLGYTFGWCWPIFVGVGGSYEFSSLNSALSRWMVWGKIGMSI